MPHGDDDVVHEQSFHNVHPDNVLHGEIEITVMDYVSQLLKVKFGCQHATLPPSYLYGLEMAKRQRPSGKLPSHVNAVQIHFVSNHYLVSSQSHGKLYIYDSLHSYQHVSLVLTQLRILYQQVYRDSISYLIPQSQGVSNLCGFYAIANAIELLKNRQPHTIPLEKCAFI